MKEELEILKSPDRMKELNKSSDEYMNMIKSDFEYLGATIEFKQRVYEERQDAFWYGDGDIIAAIKYEDYTIEIVSFSGRVKIDGTWYYSDEIEEQGLLTDNDVFSNDYDDIDTTEYSWWVYKNNPAKGVSVNDLNYEPIFALDDALNADYIIKTYIPEVKENYGDEYFEESNSSIRESKKENELTKRAKKHNKTNKKGSYGYFLKPTEFKGATLIKNAGNVEANVAHFNNVMGSSESSSCDVGSCSSGCSEELDIVRKKVDGEQKIVTIDERKVLMLSYENKSKLIELVEYLKSVVPIEFSELHESMEEYADLPWFIVGKYEYGRDVGMTLFLNVEVDNKLKLFGMLLCPHKVFEIINVREDMIPLIENQMIDEELELTTLSNPISIQDLYDEIGDDVFSEQGIADLKARGQVNQDTGFLLDVTEDGELFQLDASDLYNLNYDLIKEPYVKEILIKEFETKFPEGLSVTIDSDFVGSINSRDISGDFLRDCMEEDIFEYFSDISYGMTVSDVDLDKISEQNLNDIIGIGFPENILEQLHTGNVDEEHPLYEFYNDLSDCIVFAAEDGESTGAEADCLNDFEESLKYSCPDGCLYLGRQGEDYHTVKYLITKEYVEKNVNIIWCYNLNDFSSNWIECIEHQFEEDLKEEMANNFNEPYSGWYGFDEDSFNESLSWRLDELHSAINKQKENENKD